jgi:hypothetical protein
MDDTTGATPDPTTSSLDSPASKQRRGPKGKRTKLSPKKVEVLLRDLYLAIEHAGFNDVVKRTLATARFVGVSFDNVKAVKYLRDFVVAHHEKRHTSPHGTNGLLNTTKTKQTLSTDANRPDSEHETGRSSKAKQAGAQKNRPDSEHETGRKRSRVPSPPFSISVRSSRRAVETVENANKRAKAALENGSFSTARGQLEKLEKEWES